MKTALPRNSWATYEAALRNVAERRGAPNSEERAVLASLGLIDGNGYLTAVGQSYFELRFVVEDIDKARGVLRDRLLEWPPAIAILQLLHGVLGANRTAVESILRSRGFSAEPTVRQVGSLLVLLHWSELITYSKSTGKVVVLFNPAHQPATPASIFIDRTTPFANRVWLRRVLQECEGHIYWLDKHFNASGLEVVWEAADANRVKDIRVLSLVLHENSNARTLREYLNLKRELAAKGIAFDWRVIASAEIRDTHDRWILGIGSARNVPNLNAILSGQRSELNASPNNRSIEAAFLEYWERSLDLESAPPGLSQAS